VLFVGTLEPRKNLLMLVEAFAELDDDQTSLLLVGGTGWRCADLFARVEEPDLKNRVVFAGYAAQHELPLWYNAATAFVFPSLYEGFGLPVLEAMACGTPVLCSSASSLPEVAGGAARLFSPTDSGELTAQLDQVLSDEDLRQELAERGLARSRRFSWTRAAQETAQVYLDALQEGRPTP
jgi:glycosyltransferase involved in cell wall biosynthesis